MINELNFQKEKDIIQHLKNTIKEDLSKIKEDYENNLVAPVNIYDLNNHLYEIKLKKSEELSDITDLFTMEYLFFFRVVIIKEESIRILVLSILINCIEINPLFTNKILDAMIPIVICKIFEDTKNSSFEEKYQCLKFMLSWLKNNDENFPIIFPQSISIQAKSDQSIKIGCIEFLRIMSIIRPDLCSTVGGFKILINSLIEEVFQRDMMDKIIITLGYLISSPNKRKYFNGFGDIHKLFSIFTSSDFSSGMKNNSEGIKKQEEKEETKKIQMKLDSAIYVIKRLLRGWAGYFSIMSDKLTFGSLCNSLNSDVNIIIKKAILKLFKEIFQDGYNTLDNFNYICSKDKDYLYITKIYLAYIIKGFYENNLNENLMKFIEENENNELSEFAMKLAIKYNILFTKLSNEDLHSPILKEKMEKIKWFEDENTENNNQENEINKYDENVLILQENNYKENTRVKVMHLMDKVFHHINCKDTPFINIESLSVEVIIAAHSMLNMDIIHIYENQYPIESCKKELYSKSDDILSVLLKSSKVLELKEFHLWDWSQIDALLDIIETKKELILELNKQKFFKKLLFSYSPSKNLIVKQSWTVNNFFYGAIGRKLFKVLANSQDGISVLDSPNEDYIFQKSNSWIKDVMLCMDNLIEKNNIEENPFTIKSIHNTLSRNTFIFIGIISHSNLGDNYLNKQGFYSQLDKFISKNNTFDYLLTLIIDNVNFKSKYVNAWIQRLMLNGSDQIKKYALNHFHCLLILGKEIIIDVKLLLNALDPENPEINKILRSIFKLLISKNKDISDAFKDKDIIEKIRKIDRSFLHILMRDNKIFEYLIDIINEEVNNIDIDKIVEDYAEEIPKSEFESFETKNENQKYFLTINLSKVDNNYHNYYEYFWLKQLPFNIILTSFENKEKKDEYNLNIYMEYNDINDISFRCDGLNNQKLIFDESISTIQLTFFLGIIAINKNCNSRNNSINLTFSLKEMMKKIIHHDIKKNIFILNKDGINFTLKKEGEHIFILENIFFNINIRPEIIVPFRTPINLITELNNNAKGHEKLIEIKAVERLFNYMDVKSEIDADKNANKLKSCFWILHKLVQKGEFGEIIEKKYGVGHKIYEFYLKCDDCSTKGTILYLSSFYYQNKNLMPSDSFQVSFFFNTSIGYSTIKNTFSIDKSLIYKNDKLNDDMNLIEEEIKLNPISQEIYNNITNLANNITFKQSSLKLNEIYKGKRQLFNDINLYVKIIAVLTKYRLKEAARRIIMFYFEECIFSSEIALNCSHLLKNLGKNLLNAHKIEK